MRRGAVALGAGLAVVATVAIAVIVHGQRNTPVARATPAATTIQGLTTLPQPLPSAYDGGALRIVEQGFTQLNQSIALTLTPGYGPGHPEPYMPVRVGIVVENTSRDEVAVFPRVAVEYLTASGEAAPEGWSGNGQPTGVAAIYPGQRAGLAAYFSIDATVIKTVRVHATGAVWLARSDAATWASPVSATDVKLVHTGSPKASLVTFTAHSGYTDPVTVQPYAIYRDASGRILGSSHVDRIGGLALAPGTSAGSITVTDWLPPGLDPTRIEVYLHAGPFP